MRQRLNRGRLTAFACKVGRLGQQLAVDIPGKRQALITDPGPSSRGHGCDLMTALAAEAAPFRTGLVADRLDGRNRRADPPARYRLHLVHAADAPIADEDAGTGNQGFRLLSSWPQNEQLGGWLALARCLRHRRLPPAAATIWCTR